MTTERPEDQHPDGAHDELGHGHSVAAWAGVGIALVGFLILCLAVVFPSLVWGVVGSVVILASLVASFALSKAGYGVKDASGKPVGLRRPSH
ncbi:HGxxPAAW family protein [Kineococcus terrestris]|uniref:HGxxPAAW family protein n=1 Tax=Kineococcus terrestris TaxID=2044856 RepID=UPI0034DB2F58